jgi:hypothetical protein
MRNVLLVGVVLIEVLLPPAPLRPGQDARTLSIAGRAGSAQVLEFDGKSYVNLEDLARLTQGTLSFSALHIVLAFPAAAPTRTPTMAATPAATPATAPAAAPQPENGFSTGFLQAGIEYMSAVREWRITIVNSIENNSPISEHWISGLQGNAAKNLALAATSRSTKDDWDGYESLQALSKNMQKLSDRFLADRRSLKYIDPKSIANDRLDQQILACAHSLASMAAENQFRHESQCSEAR